MKKIISISVLSLLAGSAFAAGLDMTFFGYKCCDFSFDANPFSRDDGRLPGVYAPQCYSPAYYTQPQAPVIRNTGIAPEMKSSSDERAIMIKDSSNVTIVNHEHQQTNRPVYAPSVQTTYPTQYYYTAPTYYYTYPTYYNPYYYHRSYYTRPYYCRPYYCW